MVVAAVAVVEAHTITERAAQVIHHQHPQVRAVMEVLVRLQTITVVQAVEAARVLLVVPGQAL
jgi:hypothetical protein